MIPPKALEFFKSFNNDFPKWNIPNPEIHIPNFNKETIILTKSSALILKNHLQPKPFKIELCYLPKVIIPEKYFIRVPELPNDKEKNELTFNKFMPVQVPALNETEGRKILSNFNQEELSSVYTPSNKESTSNKSSKLYYSVFAEVPIPLKIKPKDLPSPKFPKWDQQKINLFDIIPEKIEHELPEKIPKLNFLHHEHQKNSYLIPLNKFLSSNITQNLNFPKWEKVETPKQYDFHDLNYHLFNQHSDFKSRKYMVQSITSFNPKEITDKQFLNDFFHKSFNFKKWYLKRYQLSIEMDWKPFVVDLKDLQSQFMIEQINSTFEPNKKYNFDPTKIEKQDITYEHPPIPIKFNSPTIENQIMKSKSKNETTIEIPQLTNQATYHNDTDELDILIQKKKRKLNKTTDIPTELSLISFLQPKSKTPELDPIQEPQTFQFQDTTILTDSSKKISYDSNQYILINQKSWDKNYSLLKSIETKINLIECHLNYLVDIIVNLTTGIYITKINLLTQINSKGEYLILADLIEMKLHFHKLYILAIGNESSLIHGGEILQKFQLICSSLNIIILFISKDDLELWCFEIFEIEEPYKNDFLIDIEDLNCNLLCEFGLNYFQANHILQNYTLKQFIEYSLNDKIKYFGNFICIDLLKKTEFIVSKELK
ncbi:uncharacterized protein KGF55_005733 [Candida pseudojiufengensis]|uniref:uncharacterized protein n=1 Tax=Candida pseudojiufengensis TaxID=497109 RepID=UPI0022254EC9|nr:uncharacterized protein KGF55_005733 [Candida pseudojiufengensis]KAI5958734.1 hypothetical protein KGF55_005733 [Candida pseudojiufengensis]